MQCARGGLLSATIDAPCRDATAAPGSALGRTALPEDSEQSNARELATDLAIAWLGNPNTKASAEEVPAFLEKVYGALNTLGSTPSAEEQSSAPEHTPAVSVRKSLPFKMESGASLRRPAIPCRGTGRHDDGADTYLDFCFVVERATGEGFRRSGRSLTKHREGSRTTARIPCANSKSH